MMPAMSREARFHDATHETNKQARGMKIPPTAGRSRSSSRSGFWPLTAAMLAGLCLIVSGCIPSTGGVRADAEASRFNAGLGAEYLNRGELEQARQKLEKAIQQDDTNTLAHISYARLQQRIGELDLAHVHFKRALQLQPDEAEHLNSYGVFLCETDDVDAALENFKKASENPYYKTPEFALDNAGLCLLDAGRTDEAEVYLRDALRRNPRFGNALLHMADVTLKQKRVEISDAYFGRFQQYSQHTPQSLLLGVRIKQAMGDSKSMATFRDRLIRDFPKSREAGPGPHATIVNADFTVHGILPRP